MGKIKSMKRKLKEISEEEISDNEKPAKIRSSDEPVPKKVLLILNITYAFWNSKSSLH